MDKDIITYCRNLPHILPKGSTFFITFRLVGTLPVSVLKKLVEERNIHIKNANIDKFKEEKYKADKRFFSGYDKWIDSCKTGSVWLKDNKLAKIVYNIILKFDQKRYRLLCCCIMPNHVHLLIDLNTYDHKDCCANTGTTSSYSVTDVLRRIKGASARMCNIALKRDGQFWHHESYDHYVRNVIDLHRIIKYILYNPVKAGLVDKWSDWDYSYIVDDLRYIMSD